MKKLFSLFTLLTISVMVTSPVFAQNFEINDYSLDTINPLEVGNTTNTSLADQLSTPGGILSRVLEFAFPLAGLILFVMIVWGGFETLAGSATKKSVESGRKRITAAILGFILLFASYWIIQIIQLVFGVQIL